MAGAANVQHHVLHADWPKDPYGDYADHRASTLCTRGHTVEQSWNRHNTQNCARAPAASMVKAEPWGARFKLGGFKHSGATKSRH